MAATMGAMKQIDTCHSRLMFDTERQRFRRAPKGPGFEERFVVTEWRPYAHLHLDPESDSFTVMLNEAGTRMLRSWRHTQAVCPNCGARTAELTAEDLSGVTEN